MNCSPDRGYGNTGSLSENATSAGLSQPTQRVLNGEHLGDAGIVLGERHEQREPLGAGLARRRGERRLVRADHLSVELGGRRALHDHPDRQVGRALGKGTPGHKALAHPSREQPSVHHHEPADLVGVLDSPAQPDRTAPVLNDDRYVVQVDLLEVARERLDMALVGVPILIGRLVGPAEADEVRAYNAVSVCDQCVEHVPVQVAPVRLAVETQHRWPRAFVEVVEAKPVHFNVVGLIAVPG